MLLHRSKISIPSSLHFLLGHFILLHLLCCCLRYGRDGLVPAYAYVCLWLLEPYLGLAGLGGVTTQLRDACLLGISSDFKGGSLLPYW